MTSVRGFEDTLTETTTLNPSRNPLVANLNDPTPILPGHQIITALDGLLVVIGADIYQRLTEIGVETNS